MILWFTGLSGSGKSTLSELLKSLIEKAGFSVLIVDGDAFRNKRNTENKFSKEDIIQNNKDIIAYCKDIINDYDFLIVSVISPYQSIRDEAREAFSDKYTEIFLNCPLETLIKKDVKGLYKKAIAGEINNFIGFSPNSPYETPQNPDITIDTSLISIEDSVKKIISLIKQKYGVQL